MGTLSSLVLSGLGLGTDGTDTFAIRVNSRVGMALGAVRLDAIVGTILHGTASSHIGLSSHKFKVLRFHTISMSAAALLNMIQFKFLSIFVSSRNWTEGQLIGKAMSQKKSVVDTDETVILIIQGTLPEPAGVSFEHLRPERSDYFLKGSRAVPSGNPFHSRLSFHHVCEYITEGGSS